MPISHDELDRIADDIYRERRISGAVFCGRCGYDLRTLPYVYACPECGNEYNARPLTLKGIFQPQAAAFPLGNLMMTIACAASVALYVHGVLASPDVVRVVIAVFFALFTLWMARLTFLEWRRYAMALRIMRRIAQEREADDDLDEDVGWQEVDG